MTSDAARTVAIAAARTGYHAKPNPQAEDNHQHVLHADCLAHGPRQVDGEDCRRQQRTADHIELMLVQEA